MGCCLSKKDPSSSSSIPNPKPQPKPLPQVKKVATTAAQVELEKKEEQQKVENVGAKKKEVFVIQHSRKSNDRRPGDTSDGSGTGSETVSNSIPTDPNGGLGSSIMAAAAAGQAVRTSSCTKEEVDAILIQCGRLSRSSSGKGNGNGNGNERRYSGSKRSYDFERENEVDLGIEVINGEEDGDERSRRRQSRGSNRRRRTPSRSRERGGEQRSGSSRERGERMSSGNSSRRVSRSPQRRSESPMSSNNNNHGNGNGNGNGNSTNNGRPGKLVSVPATVSSLSGGGTNGNGGDVKRVLVKRNVGSPRSQSPARGGGSGNGNQQQASLSRNGSRKAEQSPYRRAPLNEIDMNSLPFQPLANKRPMNRGKDVEEDAVVVVKQPLNSASQNKHTETNNSKTAVQGTHRRTNSRGEGYEITKTNYCRVNEHLQTPNVDKMTDHKGDPLSPNDYDALLTPVIVSGTETLKLPQTLTRSRSARRSRDLDIDVDALLTPNPTTSYNSLLLQDIQKFHQKKNSNPSASGNANVNTPFTLPPCVTKACSILEAVADLNSSTGLADRQISPRATAETTASRSETNTQFSYYHGKGNHGKGKDPFVESEVKVGDDLMEPSLHKYVTVRKTRVGGLDEEESSGSNSFVGGLGGQQNWVSSSSSWEPNSADSTDCWTSKSGTREDGFSPIGFQRHAISDFVSCGIDVGSDLKFGKNGMQNDNQLSGAARAVRTASSAIRGPIQTSRAAAASM